MDNSSSEILLHLQHGRVERVKLKRRYPRFLDSEDFVEYNNTGGPRHVPGIHLPINFERLPSIQFSHGFGAWKQERLTPHELGMIQFINDITEEENWYQNVFDFAVVRRWKLLALSQYFEDPSLWDWCLFEIIKKASEYTKDTQFIFALDSATRICKSDRLLPTYLFEELAQNTRGRSVSPWLYPFIYSGSPIRTDGLVVNLENVMRCIGGGTIPPRPYWDDDRWSGERLYYSKTSQWLASDVKFTGKGNSVRFSSPINNLHPLRHRSLYGAIERIVADSIPEWDQILLYKSLQRNGPRIKTPKRRCAACLYVMNAPCMCPVELTDFSEWALGGNSPGLLEPPSSGNWSVMSAMDGRYTNSRKLYNSISLRQGFAKNGLQVYVEVSSVEVNADGSMTAENSRRLEWDLNGNRNERIVATTLVCLRRDNVKADSGKMSFRTETKIINPVAENETGCQSLTTDMEFPPTVVARPVPPPFQKLITISLPEGRTITFPNALQHKFDGLEREDDSKAGFVQFLAIHLVDPHYVLCSTRHVPPQSVSWWWEAAHLDLLCAFHRVPPELKRYLVDYAIGDGCGHSVRRTNKERKETEEGEEGEEGGEGVGGDGADGAVGANGTDGADEADEADGADGADGGDEGDGDNDSDGDNEDDGDDAGDGEDADGGDGGGGGEQPEDPERIGYARDDSPEQVQEERPIRIEAAVKMREEAFEEHKAIMDALNQLRVYGVPSNLRYWYRDNSPANPPLDHSEPQEAGYPTVNAVIGYTGDLIEAPDGDEEYDDDDDENEGNTDSGGGTGGQTDTGQSGEGQSSQGQLSDEHTGTQQTEHHIEQQTEQQPADLQSTEAQLSDMHMADELPQEEWTAEEQLYEEQRYGEQTLNG